MTVGGVGEANAWAWMSTELDRYLSRYGWTLTNDEWPVVAAAQAVCTLAAQRISDAATAAGTQGSRLPSLFLPPSGRRGALPHNPLRSSATGSWRPRPPTAPYSPQANGSRPSKPSSHGDDSTGQPSATSPNYVSPNPKQQRPGPLSLDKRGTGTQPTKEATPCTPSKKR